MIGDVIGTGLNVAGILLGGVIGLLQRRPVDAATQGLLKLALGVLIGVVGLRTTWLALPQGFGPSMKLVLILMVALVGGNALGRWLGLQRRVNRLGEQARQRLDQAGRNGRPPLSEGFLVCTILFCVAPLALLGALIEGLGAGWHALGLKAAVDALAAMSFVKTFGPSVWLSIVPVAAFQGTVTLLARLAAPWLQAHAMLGPLLGACGLLVFCVALLVLGVHRVRWADYLPSLLVAPLLGWLLG